MWSIATDSLSISSCAKYRRASTYHTIQEVSKRANLPAERRRTLIRKHGIYVLVLRRGVVVRTQAKLYGLPRDEGDLTTGCTKRAIARMPDKRRDWYGLRGSPSASEQGGDAPCSALGMQNEAAALIAGYVSTTSYTLKARPEGQTG